MKILIDEDLDVRLRHLFPDYETYTVEYMGWKGLPNGQLLPTADSAGFALLITGDGKMVHQQNLRRLSLQILPVDRKRPLDDAHIEDLRAAVDRYLR